jgi:hypothetical protein
MPTTPLQGFPYPALVDPANGPVGFQNLATALEDKTVYDCLSTARPPHREGRLIYERDTDRIQVSDGAAWQLVWMKDAATYNLTRIASGTVLVNVNNAASGSAAVTFPAGRFTGTAPNIVATLATTSTMYIAGVGGQATTGFNANIFHRDGVVATTSLNVSWIAVQTL